MNISTERAASILDVTPDELLFMAQTEQKIPVDIDEESMTWIFNLDHVMDLKTEMELSKELE